MDSTKFIKFVIPAIPVAQPRQRHASVNGHIRNYVPNSHPVHSFKAAARMAAQQAYKGAPLEGALHVELVFVMPRPQALVWKKKPMPRAWCPKKPDRDNLEKSVYDALNGLLWRDDAQICDGAIRKVYASGSEQPKVEVIVYPLEDYCE